MKSVITIYCLLVSVLGFSQAMFVDAPRPISGGGFGPPVDITMVLGVAADDKEERYQNDTEPGDILDGDPWGEQTHRSGFDQSNAQRFIPDGTDPIPQGSLINSAILSFRSNSTRAGVVNLQIYVEDVDDAAPIGTADGAISDRFPFPTGTFVAWSPGDWSSSGTYTTPDISTLIQTVVDRAGFTTGSHFLIGICNQEYLDPGFTNVRVIRFFESSSHNTQLIINYSPPL